MSCINVPLLKRAVSVSVAEQEGSDVADSGAADAVACAD